MALGQFARERLGAVPRAGGSARLRTVWAESGVV